MAKQDWSSERLKEHLDLLSTNWTLALQGNRTVERYAIVIDGLRKLRDDNLLTDELDMWLFAAEFNLAKEKEPGKSTPSVVKEISSHHFWPWAVAAPPTTKAPGVPTIRGGAFGKLLGSLVGYVTNKKRTVR
jgi:hypothetical protein